MKKLFFIIPTLSGTGAMKDDVSQRNCRKIPWYKPIDTIKVLIIRVLICAMCISLLSSCDNHKGLLEQIKMIQPDDASENLKAEVRVADGKINNPKTADDFFLKGYVAHMDEDYDKAIESYQRAVEINPDYWQAYYNEGISYNHKGNYIQAIQSKIKSYQLNPKFLLANSRNPYEMSNYELAIQYYYQAIELRPRMAASYYDNWFAYGEEVVKKEVVGGNISMKRIPPTRSMMQRKDYYEQAINSFQKAINVKADFEDAYYQMGYALFWENKFDQAIESYQKAIDLKPDFAEAYHEMGYVYYWENKLDQAIESYQKAIDIKPGYAKAYHKIGDTYRRKEKYDQAIQAYQKAIDVDPDYWLAYHNMGIAYQNLCNRTKTEECFEKARISRNKIIKSLNK